jgi:hypothetical protein
MFRSQDKPVSCTVPPSEVVKIVVPRTGDDETIDPHRPISICNRDGTRNAATLQLSSDTLQRMDGDAVAYFNADILDGGAWGLKERVPDQGW